MLDKTIYTIEFAIQTPENIPPIHILLDEVDEDIPAIVGLDVLEGSCRFVYNIFNRLWSPIIVTNIPPEISDKWWISLIPDCQGLEVLYMRRVREVKW